MLSRSHTRINGKALRETDSLNRHDHRHRGIAQLFDSNTHRAKTAPHNLTRAYLSDDRSNLRYNGHDLHDHRIGTFTFYLTRNPGVLVAHGDAYRHGSDLEIQTCSRGRSRGPEGTSSLFADCLHLVDSGLYYRRPDRGHEPGRHLLTGTNSSSSTWPPSGTARSVCGYNSDQMNPRLQTVIRTRRAACSIESPKY